MDNQNTTVGAKLDKVVPLLQSLNRVEGNVSALALRLDPIISHTPETTDSAVPSSSSVTSRLNTLGDTLQYLLDNLEL